MPRATAPLAQPRVGPTGNRAAAISNVAHLLRRAGFGGTPSEIATAARDGLDATIDRLVDYEQTADNFTPPPADAIGLDRVGNVPALTAWWLSRMIGTSRPLQEKMTLFWHSHFATAIAKVRYPAFMYQQNQLFRDNALGTFDDLLSAVYKDPAMLIWLDGRRNTKQAANENFGREVMELFTIGHGNYTEDDVHAGSRAFTGWQLDVQTGQVRFNPRLHDDSIKTFLGHTGNFDGEDIVRILAAHPDAGPFLAGKLWRFFASDAPPANAVKAMSQTYYSTNYSIREMVGEMFSLDEFYLPATKTGHIKSPTEFVVSGIRQLGLSNTDLTTVPRTLTLLGQELFNPPNVGGWPAGASWINASTMLGRFNFASQLTGDTGGGLSAIDAGAIVEASRATRMDTLAAFIAGMLGVSPSKTTSKALIDYSGTGTVQRPDIESRVRGLIHLVLVSPEYQVS